MTGMQFGIFTVWTSSPPGSTTIRRSARRRTDVMPGRRTTGPVYPWFGQDVRAAVPTARRTRRPWTATQSGELPPSGDVGSVATER